MVTITFSGGHRLIDAGITGQEHLKDVRRAAFMGMSVDAVVRILLFLAVLGVVSMGYVLDPKDPAALHSFLVLVKSVINCSVSCSFVQP